MCIHTAINNIIRSIKNAADFFVPILIKMKRSHIMSIYLCLQKIDGKSSQNQLIKTKKRYLLKTFNNQGNCCSRFCSNKCHICQKYKVLSLLPYKIYYRCRTKWSSFSNVRSMILGLTFNKVHIDGVKNTVLKFVDPNKYCLH